MNTIKNSMWPRMETHGILPEYQHDVTGGIATILTMPFGQVIIVGSSDIALDRFIFKYVKLNPEDLLFEPVIVVHHDHLDMQGPTDGGDTQQGVLDLEGSAVKAAQSVEVQQVADLPVENGKSPFASAPAVPEDDDEL